MATLHRNDVPIHETWNLDDIFPSVDAWQAEVEYLARDFKALGRTGWSLNPDTDAQALLDCLKRRDELSGRMSRVSSYASMRYTEDSTDSGNQMMMGRASILWTDANEVFTSLRTEIIGLPAGAVERFLDEEPAMAPFRNYVQGIMAIARYQLHPDAEAALATVSDTLSIPDALYNTITSADLKFRPVLDKDGKEVPISLFSYMTQIETSPDTTLRRNAYQSLVEGLTPYQHGLAGTLGGHVRANVSLAKLRGYPSVFDMLLTESQGFDADRVPVAVFDQVLDIIQKELAPHMQRYARLRKRVLGLDKLLFSDVKAPLDVEFDPHVTFDEAGDIITGAVGVLGDEYQATMRKAFTDRWVYRGNNAGKGMIAYATGVPGAHGYVFYPWGGNLFDVVLLGHELGHAVHIDFALRYQPPTNMFSSSFYIESPSTFTEHLIVQHLRKTSDDPALHRWTNMYLMMSYHHNFVTHVLEAELLRRLYRLAEAGSPLTTAIISATKADILASFWGDTIDLDEGSSLTWMRQPHYYMGLYPYTYAVGMAASTVLAQRIQTEGKTLGAQWVEVLKQGGSKTSLDLFPMVDIDMASPEVIRQAVAHVGSIVDELERSF
jgi:oligoendopeptidase F